MVFLPSQASLSHRPEVVLYNFLNNVVDVKALGWWQVFTLWTGVIKGMLGVGLVASLYTVDGCN